MQHIYFTRNAGTRLITAGGMTGTPMRTTFPKTETLLAHIKRIKQLRNPPPALHKYYGT